jgi:hypothetical protein
MPLLHVVGILLIVAVLLWAVTKLPFLDATMVQVLRILVIVVVALWLLALFFGVDLGGLYVGRHR